KDGGQPGLRGEYFDNPDLGGAPAFSRNDRRIDFDWDSANGWPTGRNQDVSARWTGYFVPPASGDYRFLLSTYGLNEYRLYLDGNLVVERRRQNEALADKTFALRASQPYAIRLEYVPREHHSRFGFGIRKADQLIDPEAALLAARADAVLVFVGFDPMSESEGFDRTFQLPPGQDELIERIRRANKNTVVAITS